MKLVDGLAAGRSIVAASRAETAKIVVGHRVPCVVAGDRPEALAATLVAAFAEQSELRRWRAAARKLAEERYDWRMISASVAEMLLGKGAT